MRQQHLPVPEVKVAIRIPEGRRAKGMRLMRADQGIAFKEEAGYPVATIRTLRIAEIVHLVLE